ncbi:capreomycidine synthase [Lentilactobacillus sunkii]|jgi:aspartate/methionine/tyrosine aminotransferase|uniref:Aminotransferase n=1 Tax=Lentilactobacillus sunkii TaxID=481719 RepID=A0A1E7XHJ1_9LACO|nr:aminotransferase [Lentilactobacillus sunkii]OFA12519.1 capreomycidine synthase [Lentilactobacillus sunkii]
MKIAGFGVEEWLNVWEKKATYDIAQSTISSMTMQEVLDLDGESGKTFYDLLNKQKMNYGWIEGSPEFKTEVSKLYQDISPDNTLQTNGATGANHLALYALVEPGDHVISEYPSYQQLYDIPKSLGADVDYWHIHEEDGWYPDIEELKQLIRPDTKLICLNNANNPTGTILDRDFLQQVVDLAKSVGAYVLVDEVYLPLDDPSKFTSIVDLYDKGIATNSLSKTYSVPGIRVGWTATNSELADLFRKYRDYTMICCGVFNDMLATYVLRNRDKVLKRNRKLVLNNLKIYSDWIDSEPRASVIMPQGVSTSFPKLDVPEDIEQFCIRLLKEEGVLLVPGNRFDMPGHVRLGYCAQEDTLREGLKRLSKFMRQYD